MKGLFDTLILYSSRVGPCDIIPPSSSPPSPRQGNTEITPSASAAGGWLSRLVCTLRKANIMTLRAIPHIRYPCRYPLFISPSPQFAFIFSEAANFSFRFLLQRPWLTEPGYLNTSPTSTFLTAHQLILPVNTNTSIVVTSLTASSIPA